MDPYRPSRVVRVLTSILSGIYIAAWVMTGVLLVFLVSVELFADPEARRKFIIGVPTTVELGELRLPAAWNGVTGTIGLGKTEASLDVPLSLAPASFRVASYAGLIVLFAIVLMFLHQLRGLFRSARDGVPFDPRNTARLRWMGILLAAGHVFGKAFGAWQAAIVLGAIANGPMRFGPPFALDERALFALDEWVLLAALLLIALGEIFKRGSVLEDEQSLVV